MIKTKFLCFLSILSFDHPSRYTFKNVHNQPRFSEDANKLRMPRCKVINGFRRLRFSILVCQVSCIKLQTTAAALCGAFGFKIDFSKLFHLILIKNCQLLHAQ